MRIARDTLPLLVKEFLIDLDVVKNKSRLTVDEYASDLRTFFRYMLSVKENIPFSNDIDISNIDDSFIMSLTYDDVLMFLSHCKDVRGNSARTRARKTSSIRVFYHFLEAKGYCTESPMRHLETPKADKTLPKFLNLEQSKDLLNSIQGPYKERDYCIIALFLNCGMRLAELVKLNMKDISYTKDAVTVVITGKGKKQRMVYLNQACVDAIAAYVRVRPRDGVVDREALFLSRLLKRISPKTVQHIVNKYLAAIGLEKGYSVHKLRHTAATLMYQYGKVDTLALKEILGHESLGTTQIYTHLSNEQLKNAVDSNPLSGFQAQPSDNKNPGE